MSTYFIGPPYWWGEQASFPSPVWGWWLTPGRVHLISWEELTLKRKGASAAQSLGGLRSKQHFSGPGKDPMVHGRACWGIKSSKQERWCRAPIRLLEQRSGSYRKYVSSSKTQFNWALVFPLVYAAFKSIWTDRCLTLTRVGVTMGTFLLHVSGSSTSDPSQNCHPGNQVPPCEPFQLQTKSTHPCKNQANRKQNKPTK